MPATSSELRIIISAKDMATKAFGAVQKTATGAFSAIGRSVKGLFGSLTSLRGLVIGGLGFYALKRVMGDLIQESNREEQALAGLRQVLISTGRYSVGLEQSLIAQAAALQRTTIFGNEATIQGQKFLLTYKMIGEDMLPRATVAMLDLAALMGGDTVRAANMLGKAAMGLTGELRRVGITVNQATFEERGFLGVLGEIEEQVQGQAEALGRTSAGALARYQNAWGDVKEALGDIVKIFGRPVWNVMADLLGKWADQIKAFARGEEFQQWMEGVLTGFAEFGIFVINVIQKIYTAIKWVVDKIVSAFEAIINVVFQAVQKVKDFGTTIKTGMTKETRDRLQEIEDLYYGTAGGAITFKAAIDDTAPSVDFFQGLLNGLRGALIGIRDAAPEAAEAMKIVAQATTVTAPKTVTLAGGGPPVTGEGIEAEQTRWQRFFGSLLNYSQAASWGMRESMSEGFFQAMRGETRGFQAMWQDIWTNIRWSFAQILANMLADWVMILGEKLLRHTATEKAMTAITASEAAKRSALSAGGAAAGGGGGGGGFLGVLGAMTGIAALGLVVGSLFHKPVGPTLSTQAFAAMAPAAETQQDIYEFAEVLRERWERQVPSLVNPWMDLCYQIEYGFTGMKEMAKDPANEMTIVFEDAASDIVSSFVGNGHKSINDTITEAFEPLPGSLNKIVREGGMSSTYGEAWRPYALWPIAVFENAVSYTIPTHLARIPGVVRAAARAEYRNAWAVYATEPMNVADRIAAYWRDRLGDIGRAVNELGGLAVDTTQQGTVTGGALSAAGQAIASGRFTEELYRRSMAGEAVVHANGIRGLTRAQIEGAIG